jgi:hypothetical protein
MGAAAGRTKLAMAVNTIRKRFMVFFLARRNWRLDLKSGPIAMNRG